MLYQSLSKLALTHPNERVLTWHDGDGNAIVQLTRKEVKERVDNLADRLVFAWNIKKQSRVMLVFPPGLDFITAFLACMKVGIVAVPVYPPNSFGKELDRFLRITRDCDAAAVLVDQTFMWNLRAARLQKKSGVEGWPKDVPTRVAKFSPVKKSRKLGHAESPVPEDLAFLQYTSGSTGHPKGVMISQGAIFNNLCFLYEEVKTRLPQNENVRVVSWLPSYHDMGLITYLIPFAYKHRFEGFYMSPLSFIRKPLLWIEILSKYRGHLSTAPNFAYDLCVRRWKDLAVESAASRMPLPTWDLSSVAGLLNGAEPVRHATLKSFDECFCKHAKLVPGRLVPCYGLAENTLLVRMDISGKYPTIIDENGSKRVSCGTGPTDIDVQIVKRNTNEIAGPRNVGEICVCSSSLGSGYWGRESPEFCTRIPGKDQLYLNTGDLGLVDGKGQLFVCGRDKDMIIHHGRNYYANDIEESVLRASIDIFHGGVAAVSVEVDQREATENTDDVDERLVVMAELRTDKEFSDFEMRSMCQAIVSTIQRDHVIPVYAVLLLPKHLLSRTSSGKIRRSANKQAWCDGEFDQKCLFKWSRHEDDLADEPVATKEDEMLAEERREQVAVQVLSKYISTNATESTGSQKVDKVDSDAGYRINDEDISPEEARDEMFRRVSSKFLTESSLTSFSRVSSKFLRASTTSGAELDNTKGNGDDVTLGELGIDSMALVELSNELKEKLGLALPLAMMMQMTIGTLREGIRSGRFLNKSANINNEGNLEQTFLASRYFILSPNDKNYEDNEESISGLEYGASNHSSLYRSKERLSTLPTNASKRFSSSQLKNYQHFQQFLASYPFEQNLPNFRHIGGRGKEFPAAVERDMADAGMFGICFPKEYGGQGIDHRLALRLMEMVSYHDMNVAWFFGYTNFQVGLTILEFGSEEAKREYLPKLAGGYSVGTFCLSEVSSSSDLNGLQARCRFLEVEGVWSITGTKGLFLNPRGDLYIVNARGEDDDILRAFIVNAKSKGVSILCDLHYTGNPELPYGVVEFKDVRVGPESVLRHWSGNEVASTVLPYAVMSWCRWGIPSLILGACKRIVFLASSYADSRQLITGKLIKKPIVQRTLIEAHVTIRLISKFQWVLGDLMASRTPVPYEIFFIFKLASIAMPLQAMRECGILLGARQFMNKCSVTKQIQSVELMQVAEGATGVIQDFLFKASIHSSERVTDFLSEELDATEETQLMVKALEAVQKQAPGPETDAEAASCVIDLLVWGLILCTSNYWGASDGSDEYDMLNIAESADVQEEESLKNMTKDIDVEASLFAQRKFKAAVKSCNNFVKSRDVSDSPRFDVHTFSSHVAKSLSTMHSIPGAVEWDGKCQPGTSHVGQELLMLPLFYEDKALPRNRRPPLLQSQQTSLPLTSVWITELLGVCFGLFLVSAMVIPPYYILASTTSFDWLFDSSLDHYELGRALFGISAAWLCFMVAFSVTVTVTKLLLIGKLPRGVVKVHSVMYLKWAWFDKILAVWEFMVGLLWRETVFLNMFYRCMGADISLDCILGTFLREPDLVRIGVCSNVQAELITRQFRDWALVFDHITIEDNCTLLKGSKVEQNVTAYSGSCLDHAAVAREGSHLRRHTFWRGNTAFPSPSVDLTIREKQSSEATVSIASIVIRMVMEAVGIIIVLILVIASVLVVAFLILRKCPSSCSGYTLLNYLAGVICASTLVALPLLAIVIKWLLIGKIFPGASVSSYRHWWVERAIGILSLTLKFCIANTDLYILWLKAFGAQVTFWSSTMLVDAQFVEVEADLLAVGEACFSMGKFICSTFDWKTKDRVYGPVTLEDGAFCGNGSTVGPFSTVPSGCILGTHAYLPGSSHDLEPSIIALSRPQSVGVHAKPAVQMAGNPCHPMGVSPSDNAACPWSVVIVLKLWTWLFRALYLSLLFAPLVYGGFEMADALFSSSLPEVIQFFLLAFAALAGSTVWLITYLWLCSCVYWIFWKRHGADIKICRLKPSGILFYQHIWISTTVMMFFSNARLLDGTQLCAWIHKALGAQIKGPAILQMALITDIPFLKIGSRVTMDRGASLFSHQTNGLFVPLNWNEVGDNVSVDAFAHLVANRVPNETVWGTDAYMRFGTEIPVRGYYEGCQAERNPFRGLS